MTVGYVICSKLKQSIKCSAIFERTVSARFRPLSAPLPLYDLPLRAPLTLHRIFFMSAHRSAPAHSIFDPPAPLTCSG